MICVFVCYHDDVGGIQEKGYPVTGDAPFISKFVK